MRRISAALIIFVLAFLASNTVFSQDPKPETSPKSDTKPKPETKKGEPGKTDPTDPNKVPGANNGLNDGNQDSGKDGKGTKTEGLPAISLGKTEIYEPSLKALTMLFVIAVLLESAFALLFSWRVFLTYCSVSGVKTIVMLFIAWVVVYSYDVDILASLINVYR